MKTAKAVGARWVLPATLVFLVLATLACSNKQQGPSLSDGGFDRGSKEAGLLDQKISDADMQGRCAGLCSLSLLAGEAGGVGSVDGVGQRARFWFITDIVGDTSSLYISDLGNAAIRRLDRATKSVSTLAGKLGLLTIAGNQQDGTGNQATFAQPTSVALLGSTLYVLDAGWLRRVDINTGQVETIRDKTTQKPWQPWGVSFKIGLAVAGQKLYLGLGAAIGVYDPQSGDHSLLVGTLGEYGHADENGLNARFLGIGDLSASDENTLWVADGCTLRKVSIDTRRVSTAAGQTVGSLCAYGVVNGESSSAQFVHTAGVAAAGDSVYLSEQVNVFTEVANNLAYQFGDVRMYDGSVTVPRLRTLAGEIPDGTSLVGEQDGASKQARFYRPWGIWAEQNGAVFVGTWSGVRKIENGNVSTAAGRVLTDGFIKPGPIASAGQSIYVALNSRHQLIRVNPSGSGYEVLQSYDAAKYPVVNAWGMVVLGDLIYVLHERGIARYDAARSQSTSLLELDSDYTPRGLATDGSSLYLTLRNPPSGKRELWRVDPQAPKLYEVLLATTELEAPAGIAVHDGALYVADATSLRKFGLKDKKLTTVVGVSGTAGCKDGRYTEICDVKSDGTRVWFGDCGCRTVYQLDPSKKTAIHLAGAPQNTLHQAGDGAAAGFAFPRFLAFDADNQQLLISDPNDNIIVKLSSP